MYSRGHYARKKFFSSVKNTIWSAIMLAVTAVLIGVFVWACYEWVGKMGPAIE